MNEHRNVKKILKKTEKFLTQMEFFLKVQNLLGVPKNKLWSITNVKSGKIF